MIHIVPRFNLYGRGKPLRIAITICCQMAFVLFGYDQGVFSGIVTNENWLATFGYPDSALEGIIVSIYTLGCVAGCGVAFLASEQMGRRLSMCVAMVIIIVGGILQATAFSTAHLMIARWITGVGTGIETSNVPIYHTQAELCESDKRGRLLSSEVMLVGVGIVIAYWFDYGMSFIGGSIAWRLPIACQVIFAFAVIFIVLGLPESPRFMYKRGDNAAGLAILCDVYDSEPDNPKIVKEQQEILEALNVEQEQSKFKWSQLFKKDEVQTGRRVLLAYGMQFMNQIGGINLIVYYITSVLQNNVGMSRNMSMIMAGVINIMFVVGALWPSFTLDRSGRRVPMMVGSFVLGMCMMMISILLSFKDRGGQIALDTASASVAFFFLFMLFYGATAAVVPWVYVPEILPLQARAKGTAIGISSNWLWNFVVVMVTPTLIEKLQWKAYLIFTCTNLSFVPLVYFCYPETSNLTLEEVDWLFVDADPVRTSLQIARRKWGGAAADNLESAKGLGRDKAAAAGAAGVAEAAHVEEKPAPVVKVGSESD